MAENGNGSAGATIKLSGWQLGLFAALMVTGVSAAVGNWLSVRDWRVAMTLRVENIEKSTALPRETFELEKKLMYAEIEQLRTRINAQERRRDDP